MRTKKATSKKVTPRTPKAVYVPQALKVYWANERYGERLTAILCPQHRDKLFAVNPSACGQGEYSAVESCDLCQGKQVPPFRGRNL